MDCNFACLDDNEDSCNSDVDARDSGVTDECDIGCKYDCCVNDITFVTKNVTGSDKGDGVG